MKVRIRPVGSCDHYHDSEHSRITECHAIWFDQTFLDKSPDYPGWSVSNGFVKKDNTIWELTDRTRDSEHGIQRFATWPD